MLGRRTKIYVLLFLILALIVLITPNRSRVISNKLPNNGKTPILEVNIILWESQHELLLEQFHKFSDKHGFIIRISQTKPTGKDFLVQMWRDDIEIDGVNGDPGSFRIFFNNASEEYPASVKVIDEVINDLKGLIGEIANTTFTIIRNTTEITK